MGQTLNKDFPLNFTEKEIKAPKELFNVTKQVVLMGFELKQPESKV